MSHHSETLQRIRFENLYGSTPHSNDLEIFSHFKGLNDLQLDLDFIVEGPRMTSERDVSVPLKYSCTKSNTVYLNAWSQKADSKQMSTKDWLLHRSQRRTIRPAIQKVCDDCVENLTALKVGRPFRRITFFGSQFPNMVKSTATVELKYSWSDFGERSFTTNYELPDENYFLFRA